MAETSGHWATEKEAGTAWQLRLMRFLALKSPRILSTPLLWVIALVFAADKRRTSTRASEAYLHRVLDHKPTFCDRHRHALAFSRVFFERVGLLAHGLNGYSVSLSGETSIAEQVAKERGAILLGAHYGSFEALRALDQALPGLSVRYLMYPEHAENSTRLLNSLNPDLADRVISLANGPMAMIQVYEALENGEFVAFLGDRVPDSSIRAKVSVKFLGGNIDVPTSPFLAAMAAEVPIFLSFATWERGYTYHAEFQTLYNGEPVPRSQRDAHTETLAQQYIKVVEDLCRRHPYNWFNFFNIWSK